MIKFTKSNTITGVVKGICVHNGLFVDNETGEVIALAEQLEQAFGDEPFDLKVTRKSEVDE